MLVVDLLYDTTLGIFKKINFIKIMDSLKAPRLSKVTESKSPRTYIPQTAIRLDITEKPFPRKSSQASNVCKTSRKSVGKSPEKLRLSARFGSENNKYKSPEKLR